MLVQEAANELIEMLLDVGEEEIPEKGISAIFVLHFGHAEHIALSTRHQAIWGLS